MTDRDAFLRAVLADPADDTPRLVYADWLEEHGEPDRAEFIRVQCELAKHVWPPRCELGCKAEGPPGPIWCTGCGHDPKCCRCEEPPERTALRRRERQLWMSRGWAHLPSDWRPSSSVHIDQTLPRDSGGATIAIVRRGFVGEVTCTAADWLGGPCERCDGGGQRVGADRPFEYMPNSTEALRCPDCSGSGRVPGLADAVYWRPGQTVECPDKWCSKENPGRLKNNWHWTCDTCAGTGRVPRPFPPGAQPVERVRLTTRLPLADRGMRTYLEDGRVFADDRWLGVLFEEFDPER